MVKIFTTNVRPLLYSLLLVCLSLSCNGQYFWHALPGAPKSYRFDDFYFINPDTGWAINPNYGASTPRQYGRVFRTTDGGNTWVKLKDSSNTYYRSVGFADASTGWIGNLADTQLYGAVRYTNDTTPLYQTNDGGTTWVPVNLPYPHPLGICGISVVTDSIVFAYGRFFGPAGYVKTTDKGASWTYTNLDSLAFGLIDGHFVNKDTGFITAMGADHKAAILYTVNGGASWSTCYHSTRSDTDRVWKIYFPSRNVGYGSIQYGGSYYFPFNTWFVKTTDGGVSWTEHPFSANYDEEGIGFINDSVGWIGGDYTRGTYKTTDGGATWYTDETFGVSTPPYTGPYGFSINRFRSFGDTLMYSSGNTLYKLNTENTSVKSVIKKGASIYNAPNPFDNETSIVFTLPQDMDNTSLVVTNILGQRVYTKNLGSQSKGLHHLIFNEYLAAGIYYYTIGNGQFKIVNKMVVVR